MLVRNVSRNLLLGRAIRRADRFYLRLLGLMFRRELSEGEGLWIEPCRSVHTHFMRFPIDVLFIDRQGGVLHVIPAMQPWRFSPVIRQAAAVLELPAGAAGSTVPGDRIACKG
ncbi:MAG: DUF192 domain-containing protein [Bacillota bacterium]